jgi:2-polyprenyl-6-methoxyphenol hydroxylase-like FAD-dependent oxidoreductase
MNWNENAHVVDPSVGAIPDEVEVAVVGAGPVGLTTAAMLFGYGVRVAVLDAAAGPAPYSRAAVVHARTLETLAPLGVVGEMVQGGVVVPNFGVRDRDRRLLAVPFGDLPTAHPYSLMLPQDETERHLRGALHRQGGKILWSHELIGVRQDGTGAELKVRSPQGVRRLRARYVVGGDGAHSSVREAVRIPFEGDAYPQSFVLADVLMDWGLPDDEVQLFFSPEGLVVVAPLPHGRHRVVATMDEAPPEPTLADIQALLDARGPRTPRSRIEEIVWASRFRVHHRVAAAFREGAVFLAGDAAHVHSPAGGQGMNTGIQDAANLAWKLALVLRGQAPDSLLDSYERERRPVAREVVSTTDRLTQLATMRSPVFRWMRNVLISGGGRVQWLPRRLARNLAEIDVAYDGGWRVDGSTAERRVSKRDGALSNLDPALRLVVPEDNEAQAVADAAYFPSIPVRVVPEHGLGAAVLVRPDGYVAGRDARGDHVRLLELLARALEAEARREPPEIKTQASIKPKASISWKRP